MTIDKYRAALNEIVELLIALGRIVKLLESVEAAGLSKTEVAIKQIAQRALQTATN